MLKKFILTCGIVMLGCMILPHICLAQCANPDVDKPHNAGPGAECWGGCTDPGYENTCTQAASANVIFAECCSCGVAANQIYQDLVNMTGNVGQFPEEERASMLAWVAANCPPPQCVLEITIAHKGYAGQPAVNEGNVTFDWADQEIARGEHIKLWVIEASKLPFPPAPTGKAGGSHELTYKGRAGSQAHIHDSDCDIDGTDDDYYEIGSDANGDYLQDYWGPGNHGRLHGVISVSGTCRIPTLTEWGMIIFCVLLFGWMTWVVVRRRRRVTVGI